MLVTKQSITMKQISFIDKHKRTNIYMHIYIYIVTQKRKITMLVLKFFLILLVVTYCWKYYFVHDLITFYMELSFDMQNKYL